MAKSFAADVRKFANMTKENMRSVMQESIQDVLEAAQTPQPAAEERGGPPEQGKIPVDFGFLINSLISGLNGSFSNDGQYSYVMAIQGMEIGDIAQFAWTAEYAMAVEMGHGTYPGAHFVGVNAERWPSIVEMNAKRV